MVRFQKSVIIHVDDFFMICNNHPILDDSSHPFLDVVNIHPIFYDSSHPKMDDVSIHPILDDSSHPFLNVVNYHPILDDSPELSRNNPVCGLLQVAGNQEVLAIMEAIAPGVDITQPPRSEQQELYFNNKCQCQFRVPLFSNASMVTTFLMMSAVSYCALGTS